MNLKRKGLILGAILLVLTLPATYVFLDASEIACFTKAKSLDFKELEQFPLDIQRFTSKEGSDWSMFAKHEAGDHNEGTGKWYLHARERLPVYAPADMYICTVGEEGRLAKQKQKNAPNVINGQKIIKDIQMNAAVSGDIELEFDHIWILEELSKKAFLGDPLVKKGELIGYTAISPEEGTALDFKIKDFTHINGFGEESGIDHNVCPLYYFSEDLQSLIKEHFLKYYEQIKQEQRNPEAAEDSCNALFTNEEGTVWGLWFNSRGKIKGSYHNNLGTVHFFPRGKYNTETYTPFIDEIAYYTEMKDDRQVGGGKLKAPARVFRLAGNEKQGCLRLEEEWANPKRWYLHFEVSKQEQELLTLSYSEKETVCENKELGETYTFTRTIKN